MPFSSLDIRIKRAYEPPAVGDGRRILIDRLWPRGVRKEAASIERWLRDLAPSDELRKWFRHDPALWEEFRRRYRAELSRHAEELDALLRLAEEGPMTLVFGARDAEHNNAVVLRAVLLERSKAATS